MSTNQPHINDLREHLLGALAALTNRDNPMEPDRARAIAQVASVLVDTARVEVDYLKATGQDCSNFIDPAKAPVAAQHISMTHQGNTVDRARPGSTIHRLAR